MNSLKKKQNIMNCVGSIDGLPLFLFGPTQNCKDSRKQNANGPRFFHRHTTFILNAY